MKDPIARIASSLYEPAELCDCCESQDEHKEKVDAAYEKWADSEFERRRDER